MSEDNVILKTSGGTGSFLIAPRLFEHEVLRIIRAAGVKP